MIVDSNLQQCEITRDGFGVSTDGGSYVQIRLASFTQALLPTVSLDTIDAFDRRVSAEFGGVCQMADFDRLTWTEVSTRWHKTHYLDVYPDHLVFHSVCRGSGAIERIRYFDVIEDSGFIEHFALLKHFNDKDRTHPREYSTGSPPGFKYVLCPEGNSRGKQIFAPFENAQVSISADFTVNGGNFAANPGIFSFAVAQDPVSEWLSLGLAAPPGEHLFSDFDYLGGRTFALSLSCWGALRIRGEYRPPAIVLVPGASAADALRGYVGVLTKRHPVPRPAVTAADWWQRPMACGWGHQCYQADLFRVRSPRERPPDTAAYTLSTQATYRDIVETLDRHDVPWGTLIIDARWHLAGGLKTIDIGRWPDLRGFIDALHDRGRRVLLYWSPWDTDGLPGHECVRDRLAGLAAAAAFAAPQQQARRAGKAGPGGKLAIDITLPAARARVAEQVRTALGSGPGCWNADGLKLDHLADTPGTTGMAFEPQSGRLFGIEAAHAMLAVIYAAAKEAKDDALILGESPSPYFADVQDMTRLGDTYTQHASSILTDMRFRADMAAIAQPGGLIMADGWPVPSLAAWREYAAEQPAIGIPSLYYATHLDTTGEAFGPADYALVRQAWRDR